VVLLWYAGFGVHTQSENETGGCGERFGDARRGWVSVLQMSLSL
jgi:hypothetical protein